MNYITYWKGYVTVTEAKCPIFVEINISFDLNMEKTLISPTEIQKNGKPIEELKVAPVPTPVVPQAVLNPSHLKWLRKLKVLLVEDNRLSVIHMKGLFSENKMTLQVAPNGSACIEKLKKEKFDIILMDLKMPVLTGYETTVIIRNELKSNIPILAMTGYETLGDRERCLGIGMNDYISKPLDPNLLFEKMYALTFTSRQNDNKPA